MNYNNPYSTVYNVTVTPITNLVIDNNNDVVGVKSNSGVNRLEWDGQSQVKVIEYQSSFKETSEVNVADLEPAYHLIVSPENENVFYYILEVVVKN